MRDLSRFGYGFREIRFRSAAGGKFWDGDPFRNAILTLKNFKCGANLTYFPFIYHICAPKFSPAAQNRHHFPFRNRVCIQFWTPTATKKYDFAPQAIF